MLFIQHNVFSIDLYCPTVQNEIKIQIIFKKMSGQTCDKQTAACVVIMKAGSGGGGLGEVAKSVLNLGHVSAQHVARNEKR